MEHEQCIAVAWYDLNWIEWFQLKLSDDLLTGYDFDSLSSTKGITLRRTQLTKQFKCNATAYREGIKLTRYEKYYISKLLWFASLLLLLPVQYTL